MKGKRKKGKEYYENGDIKFDGEYLAQKRWNGNGYTNSHKYVLKNGKGYVYEFYENDNLWYEGNYLNGEKNGNKKKLMIEIGKKHGCMKVII